MKNFYLHVWLNEHIAWSKKTFGPGKRTVGIIEHIRTELEEIRANPADLMEWIDVLVLGFDGAWRAGYSTEQILEALNKKQQINFAREYPMPTSEDEPSFHEPCDHEFVPFFTQHLFRENVLILDCVHCHERKAVDAHQYLDDEAKKGRINIFNSEVTIPEVAVYLAKYFDTDGERYPGPCACTGIEGHCTYCSQWWEYFLRHYPVAELKQHLRKLVEEKGWNDQGAMPELGKGSSC